MSARCWGTNLNSKITIKSTKNGKNNHTEQTAKRTLVNSVRTETARLVQPQQGSCTLRDSNRLQLYAWLCMAAKVPLDWMEGCKSMYREGKITNSQSENYDNQLRVCMNVYMYVCVYVLYAVYIYSEAQSLEPVSRSQIPMHWPYRPGFHLYLQFWALVSFFSDS